MIWLAPWALGAGALGVLGVLASHLLARQRPRALALATTRFLPGGVLEATTVQRTPMDRWWMLLRMLIVALLALGAAQPVLQAKRVNMRTVLLLDRTLPEAVQRTVIGTLAAGDVVIQYDSVARLKFGADSVLQQRNESSLSAALAQFIRVRDSLTNGAERIRVAVASTFDPASFDPASPTLRSLVPDSIVVLPLQLSAPTPMARGAIVVRATGDDPVAATAILLGDSAAPARTVIERGPAPGAADSVDARNGAIVVWWPARSIEGTPAPRGLTVARRTWIAPMIPDSTQRAPARSTAVGWWADGAPAVWATRTGDGCLIQVNALLPRAGDHTLSLSAQAWLAALVTVCERPSHARSQPPAWLAPAPTRLSGPTATAALRSSSAPWLVAAALLLAALELALRRTVARV